MSASGRTIWAGFSWLTAVMTLVTSLPHFQCQCPNGSIKPLCFGVFCSSTSCCCGDACSSALNASRSNGQAACCRGHGGARFIRGASDGSRQVQTPGCQKSLAQRQHFLPVTPTKAAQSRGVVDSTLPVFAAFPRFDSAHTSVAKEGLHSAAPPPSDLVIVLQRFLI